MQYTQEELNTILKKHEKWLRGDSTDSQANLYRADFSGANLYRADFSGANLYKANLSWANLYKANLSGANLSGANLYKADLSGANLSGANLSGANLQGAIDGSVCRMDFGKWSVCIRSIKTTIGCQTHENIKWLNWSPKDVKNMATGAEEFWSVHGWAIKAAIMCVMKKANV
jgi:uncharacterized protein YjbI with pentapeptide repeats